MSRGVLPAPRLLAVAAACAALAACTRAGAPAPGTTIMPQPLTETPAAAAAPATVESTSDASSRPRISIDPALTILQVLNVNLDNDPEEEQVIAVKLLADVDSPVRVIIADADPAQGSYYYQSWEGESAATDARVFSLSVKDIVGDHGTQIIASGMSEAGKLTLDVFRSVPPGTGKGLAYKSVFQLVADEVSIEESERPDTYATEGTPAPAFPIQAFLRDPDSQNMFDLVSIRYTWNGAESRYTPGAAVKVPGEDVQQAQLSALYLSVGEDAFERFIQGSWVQIDPAPGGKGGETYTSILDFDPRQRTIAVATGNAEDVYVWQESHRTIYKMLLVIGENMTVPLIKLIRRFTITADAPNSITVRISGDDSVEATTIVYTKVTDDIRARLLDRTDARAGPAPVSLQGRYIGQGGMELEFGDSTLTWTDASGTRTGSYVIFSLGTAAILTTRVGGRATAETRSWLLSYSELRGTTRVTRNLGMSPVRLTVNGHEDTNGQELNLSQSAEITKASGG